MRKFDQQVSARLSFSPKYCRAVAINALKSFVFMYHEAVTLFLGSKNVLSLVYFWVEYIFKIGKFNMCRGYPPLTFMLSAHSSAHFAKFVLTGLHIYLDCM